MNSKELAERTIESVRKYMKINPAELASNAILHDISDRNLLKDCGKHVENEMKEVFVEIIKKCYEDR